MMSQPPPSPSTRTLRPATSGKTNGTDSISVTSANPLRVRFPTRRSTLACPASGNRPSAFLLLAIAGGLLVEANVDASVGIPGQLPQRLQLAQPQQGGVLAVCGSSLLLRPQCGHLGLGLDALCRGLRLGLTLLGLCPRLGLQTLDLCLGLGVDAEPLRLRAGVDQRGLTGALGDEHAVHDLLDVTGEDQVLDVG